METTSFVSVGKIVGAHGIVGNIKVNSSFEWVSLFKPGIRVFVQKDEDSKKAYEIRWVKPHLRLLLLSLKGIDDRNDAESVIGSELYVERRVLPETEKGEYYWFDIIGLDVYTTEDEHLGKVGSIIETGSNDVYVVNDPDKNPKHEILIPALESVVLDIDINRKMIRVELPEGLR